MSALKASYGDLSQPDFRKVYSGLENSAYRQVTEELRAEGIEVTDATDLNDDVAIHLDVDQGDQGGWVALSGAGPFAALIWQDSNRQYLWVTQSDKAPSPLAALVANAVERAGFKLLSRDTAAHKISMSRADGSTEATLYQALFTDSDVIP